MGIWRVLALLCALLLLPCLRAEAEDKLEAELKSFGIKVERNADNKIVQVALPVGARDYHLELVLDNPAVAKYVTEIVAPKCRASFKRVKELADLPALPAINFNGVQNANDYAECLVALRLKNCR